MKVVTVVKSGNFNEEKMGLKKDTERIMKIK